MGISQGKTMARQAGWRTVLPQAIGSLASRRGAVFWSAPQGERQKILSFSDVFERACIFFHAKLDFTFLNLEFVEFSGDIDEGFLVCFLSCHELIAQGIGVGSFDVFESGERLGECVLVLLDFVAARLKRSDFGADGFEILGVIAELSEVFGQFGRNLVILKCALNGLRAIVERGEASVHGA